MGTKKERGQRASEPAMQKGSEQASHPEGERASKGGERASELARRGAEVE